MSTTIQEGASIIKSQDLLALKTHIESRTSKLLAMLSDGTLPQLSENEYEFEALGRSVLKGEATLHAFINAEQHFVEYALGKRVDCFNNVDETRQLYGRVIDTLFEMSIC